MLGKKGTCERRRGEKPFFFFCVCYFWRPLHGRSSKEATRTKTLLKELSHYHEEGCILWSMAHQRTRTSTDILLAATEAKVKNENQQEKSAKSCFAAAN